MYLDIHDYSSFSFGHTNPSPKAKPIMVKDDDGSLVNPMERKAKKRAAFTEFYRRQNERLRKPCPKCPTLVQPHLLGQHYEAYHPGTPIPASKKKRSS